MTNTLSANEYAAKYAELSLAIEGAKQARKDMVATAEAELVRKSSDASAAYLKTLTAKERRKASALSQPEILAKLDTIRNEIYEYWKLLVDDANAAIKDSEKVLDDFLFVTSPETISLRDDWVQLRTSCDSNYRTQGWSATSYAMGELRPYVRLLHDNKIPWEVGLKKHIYRKSFCIFTKQWETHSSSEFRLRAKCDEWAFESLVAKMPLGYRIEAYGNLNAAVFYCGSSHIYDAWTKVWQKNPCPEIVPVVDEIVDDNVKKE